MGEKFLACEGPFREEEGTWLSSPPLARLQNWRRKDSGGFVVVAWLFSCGGSILSSAWPSLPSPLIALLARMLMDGEKAPSLAYPILHGAHTLGGRADWGACARFGLTFGQSFAG
jgi:hypothetical protein